MIRVRVQYKVSLGRATDTDMTGRVPQPIEGELLLLRQDWPLVLALPAGRIWQTQSKITRIDGDLAAGQTVEIHSARSVYRVRRLDNPTP